MVFTSVPCYLDPPNWHQQENHQQQGNMNEIPHQLPPPSQTSVGVSSTGSIRPNSMADRARLAKLPQPETALKCPRCESTNTKFCYFNNYSLTQPRHFCKTCRRYWTRGGALRSVPVGGGCRRNKRSKGNSSKSSVTAERPKGSTSSTSTNPSNSFTTDAISHMQPSLPHFPFITTTSLHHLSDYGGADMGYNFSATPIANSSATGDVDFTTTGCATILSNGAAEQWRSLQKFPYLPSLEPQTGLYSFIGDGADAPAYASADGQLRGKPSASVITQLASIKMEENQGLNLPRQYMGLPGNDQYWGVNNAWTDLSSFTSSSTTHLL